MNPVVSPEALRDLTAIHDFIAQENPRAAQRVLDRLTEMFRRLAEGQVQGSEVRLTDGRRVRSWPLPPYRIYYQRTSSEMVIVRVYHQARQSIEA